MPAWVRRFFARNPAESYVADGMAPPKPAGSVAVRICPRALRFVTEKLRIAFVLAYGKPRGPMRVMTSLLSHPARGGRCALHGGEVLRYCAGGAFKDAFVADFPQLTHDDVRARLTFAAERERKTDGCACRERSVRLLSRRVPSVARARRQQREHSPDTGGRRDRSSAHTPWSFLTQLRWSGTPRASACLRNGGRCRSDANCWRRRTRLRALSP